MNSDEKIKMIEEIIGDNEKPVDTISGPTCCGNQLIGFTKEGRSLLNEMFGEGKLSNPLKDCTIIIKIEDHKAQVSVVHTGVVIFEFKPVESKFSSSTFEFPGISIPLTMNW